MIVTTGERVAMSFGSAALSLSATDFLFEAARLDFGAEARGEHLRGVEIDRAS